MRVGYTTGVFDLFHIGHLNILKAAKGMCDILIVGISTDELVKKKGKKALVPYEERIRIVEAIKYVDLAIPQTTADKWEDWRKLHFDVMFVGDDWFGDEKWKEFEQKGLKVVYLPYTTGVSSTLRRARLK